MSRISIFNSPFSVNRRLVSFDDNFTLSLKKEVIRDKEEALRLGVRAVPSFAANGRILASGVQTADRLRELLERYN